MADQEPDQMRDSADHNKKSKNRKRISHLSSRQASAPRTMRIQRDTKVEGTIVSIGEDGSSWIRCQE